jgi:hypothetical protein
MPANIGISAGAIEDAKAADVSHNPVPTRNMKGATHRIESGIPDSQAAKGNRDLLISKVGVSNTAHSPKRNAITSQIPSSWLNPSLVTTNQPDRIATDKEAHAKPRTTTGRPDRSAAGESLMVEVMAIAEHLRINVARFRAFDLELFKSE